MRERERGTKRKREESGEGRDMHAQFGDGGMIFGACAENLPGEKFMLVVGKHCERQIMRAPGWPSEPCGTFEGTPHPRPVPGPAPRGRPRFLEPACAAGLDPVINLNSMLVNMLLYRGVWRGRAVVEGQGEDGQCWREVGSSCVSEVKY